MKLYDISQEVLGCEVYPGDPKPKSERLCSIEKGDLYNLTSFSMCAHNGTHVDAPAHFIADGKTVDAIPLERMIGRAFVVCHNGEVTSEHAADIIKKAELADRESAKRILIKGDAVVTVEAAAVFADGGIFLLGNESQSVGPENAPMEVHRILLKSEVVLLEGIRLGQVHEGVYMLFAAPLSLAGAEGSPCRAILVEF